MNPAAVLIGLIVLAIIIYALYLLARTPIDIEEEE